MKMNNSKVEAVKIFLEIVNNTKLNSFKLNNLEIFGHVILGGDEYTIFAERGLL